jgi:hypothetical protein
MSSRPIPPKMSSLPPACLKFVLVFVFLLTLGNTHAGSSVSQWGITWNFSTDRPTGQFVNGDWWVLGPVTITGITPASSMYGGSMINPVPGQPQGLYFDNPWASPAYNGGLNVGLGLPVTIEGGNSLFSTINNPHTWVQPPEQEKTWFKETAVLTVVQSVPAAGSFRPPYAGSDKSIKPNWNLSRLNYSVLRSLAAPVPANVPDRVWLENATQRPLLEMNFNWPNSNWKSSWGENKLGGYPRRTYGREISHISSGAGLFLQTNVPNATKEKLLIHMCQWGIDVCGLVRLGMQWQSNGGHNLGRMMPLFLAANVLDDPEMLEQLREPNGPFQEYYNHYFIHQEDIDRPRAPGSNAAPYTQAMLGMPEWSSGGRFEQSQGSSTFVGDVGYRFINGAPNCGVIAAILLMGKRHQLEHEAYVRYITERYYPKMKGNAAGVLPSYGDDVTLFTRDMWDTYLTNDIVPPSVPVGPIPRPDPSLAK